MLGIIPKNMFSGHAVAPGLRLHPFKMLTNKSDPVKVRGIDTYGTSSRRLRVSARLENCVEFV